MANIFHMCEIIGKVTRIDAAAHHSYLSVGGEVGQGLDQAASSRLVCFGASGRSVGAMWTRMDTPAPSFSPSMCVFIVCMCCWCCFGTSWMIVARRWRQFG